MSEPNRPAPPRVAEIILRIVASSESAEYVLSDFREAFDNRVVAVDASNARRWYWQEMMRSVAPLLRQRMNGSGSQQRGEKMLSTTIGDARYALRLSRRAPLASFAIIATMVLGIGSTTAVFSAMNAVLLQPLPFPHSERTVQLSGVERNGSSTENLAYPDLMDFRRSVPELAAIAVFQPMDATLQQADNPQLVKEIQVDDVYPRVFGTRVALGRLITAADAVVDAPRVAVMSYDFWLRQFGGDRSIIGRMITLNNESVQVVGVLERGSYTYPRPEADLLTPLVIYPNSMMVNRGAMWADAAGLMKPGATVAQTQRDLAKSASVIEKQFPRSNEGISAAVKPLRDAVTGSVQPMLKLLAAAVAAVLLIACINIANLILGRAQGRSREFAVRSAIGGSPSRVRRQILVESLVLAAIGGVIGIAIAPALTHALIAMYPEDLPRANEIGVNGAVLTVAILATIMAGLLSALPTARRAGRLDLVRDLRDGARLASGRGERSVGRVLIISQVAASLALLFAAGLLLQTFERLSHVDPGFDVKNVTTFHVFAPSAKYNTRAQTDRYFSTAMDALRTIPGVEQVATSTLMPFGGSRFRDVFVEEEHGDLGATNPMATIAFVGPDFEHAMGIPVLRGRSFTAADDTASEHVLVVNEAIAKQFYGGTDPIGHMVNYNGMPHWRIIGVVASTHIDDLWQESPPILYVPSRQLIGNARFFVVRSKLPSDQVLSAARAKLHQIDASIAITDPMTMAQRIQKSIRPQRFRAGLMAAMGALALLLAIIGIYGVVSYAVSRRTREIGIRMALGEGSDRVRRRVMGEALGVACVGIAVGLMLAIAAGKWLSTFLVNVSPHDPKLLAAASLLLAIVVCAAAYAPARRAAKVDPLNAWRAD